jgi:SAM-dependent methyltransferase
VHTEEALAVFGEWERIAWEQRAGAYALTLGDLTRGSIPMLLDAAGVGVGTRVLDVGTGPGFVALAAVARGAVAHGADQSAAMVDIARAVGVDAVLAPAEALPFDDATFEAVVAGYLLNHLPRPEMAVAELGRVLTTGGRLAMTVWDVPSKNPAIGLVGSVVADMGLTSAAPPGPDAARFADEAEVRSLLANWNEVGFERLEWTFRIAPGAWFDAIADATPRAGAVLAQAGAQSRALARTKYLRLATERYGVGDGLIDLPVGAVLISATKANPSSR